MNLVEYLKKIEEVMNELLPLPEELIDTVLLKLLLNNKIDFVKLSNLYIESLKKQDKDKDNLLYEAESCALEHLINIKKESKLNHNAVHRTLYLLNKSRRFMMNKLNEKFNYNEDEDKKLSWYEMNKDNN